MYGINEYTRQLAISKINSNKFYLDNNFITLGNNTFPLSQFTKNAYINSDRYIAEIQNRVHALYDYSRSRDLVNVFFTMTLPTEYHPHKTIKLKNGTTKSIPNPKFINDEEHSPRSGSKQLSKLLSQIFNSRLYRYIPKDDRVYFRVTEPHKDGTPHLHISFFIPKEYIYRFSNLLFDTYDFRYNKFEVNIKNPVSYLMKYIYKSLDDLRIPNTKETDLTLWYVFHGISRIYTSRTLVSLDVYRALAGKYTLIELTNMVKDFEICIFLNTDNKRLKFITHDTGFAEVIIWEKSSTKDYDPNFNNMRVDQKPTLKHKYQLYEDQRISLEIDDRQYFTKPPFEPEDIHRYLPCPAYMSDYELYHYHRELDLTDDEIPVLHYNIAHNEAVNRYLIDKDLLELNEEVIPF